ncbi:UMP kinase [Candidatus Aerophobetes bacterium]|nr:UMP kinase [Candidatus Aerophobetes bacterium]
MEKSSIKWNRILLKIGGESLSDKKDSPFSSASLNFIAEELVEIVNLGVKVGVIIGGGNILRGKTLSQKGIERTTTDYMGMLGTIINALALQSMLEKKGIITRLQTAIEVKQVAEPYIRRRALRHLEKGRLLLFAGGTGNPYFTTDTAAALRALEIGAGVILKATKVDGVYSNDPLQDVKAKKFDKISYEEILRRKLKVMDATAISLCMENNLPIIVFNFRKKGNIKKIILGEKIGTRIGE